MCVISVRLDHKHNITNPGMVNNISITDCTKLKKMFFFIALNGI